MFSDFKVVFNVTILVLLHTAIMCEKKCLKSTKMLEYILKVIIRNHGHIHSVVFEMNLFIKGENHTYPHLCMILDRLEEKIHSYPC